MFATISTNALRRTTLAQRRTKFAITYLVHSSVEAVCQALLLIPMATAQILMSASLHPTIVPWKIATVGTLSAPILAAGVGLATTRLPTLSHVLILMNARGLLWIIAFSKARTVQIPQAGSSAVPVYLASTAHTTVALMLTSVTTLAICVRLPIAIVSTPSGPITVAVV